MDNTPSELDLLKSRAKQMGIKFHHKIGAVKLNKLIQEKMGQKTDEETFPDVDVDGTDEAEGNVKEVVEEITNTYTSAPTPTKHIPPKKETKAQRNTRMRKDASRQIRISVSCMNPAKKDYEGEYYTAGNGVVGFFTKYIPFNAEDGWHVPNILYKHLIERQCQVFYTAKGPRGNKVRKGKLIKEFSIQVLPPLTRAEIKELAIKQSMAGTIGTD